MAFHVKSGTAQTAQSCRSTDVAYRIAGSLNLPFIVIAAFLIGMQQVA
jgi:hypothetical protein